MRTYALFIWTDIITASALIGMKCTGNINPLLVILFGVFVPVVFSFGVLNLNVLGLGAKGFLVGFAIGENSIVALSMVYLWRYNWDEIEVEEEEEGKEGCKDTELEEVLIKEEEDNS